MKIRFIIVLSLSVSILAENQTEPLASETGPKNVNTNSTTLLNNTTKLFSDFRPSLQVSSNSDYVYKTSNPVEGKSFWDNSENYQIKSNSKVTFPEIKVPTTKDRPYQFYGANNNGNNEVGKAVVLGSVIKVPITETRTWDQGLFAKKPIEEKRTYVGETGPHAPFYETPYTEYHIEEPHHHAPEPHRHHHKEIFGSYTWKKIAKFLTAIIPIGLLISALTPTVITVTNTNDSRIAGRKLQDFQNFNDLFPALQGLKKNAACENRILCELLLVSSTSKDPELNMENFINTYLDNKSKKDYSNEKIENLKNIFEGVRKEDCSLISCT